jgi:hypothetical protein
MWILNDRDKNKLQIHKQITNKQPSQHKKNFKHSNIKNHILHFFCNCLRTLAASGRLQISPNTPRAAWKRRHSNILDLEATPKFDLS